MTDTIPENLVVRESEPITGIRVLAAEDDPSLRILYARLFGGLVGGSKPFAQYVIVKNAQEALRLFTEPGSRFNVLMTDYHMPGENGAELARRIKSLDPNVLTVLVSSKTRQHLDSDEAQFIDLELPKPFGPQEAVSIADVIQQHLSKPK